MRSNAFDSKQRRVADAIQNTFAQPIRMSKGLDCFKLACLRRGCNPLEQLDVPYIRPVYSQLDAFRSAKDKPGKTRSGGCRDVGKVQIWGKKMKTRVVRKNRRCTRGLMLGDDFVR